MKAVNFKTTAGANLRVCLTAVWLCLILFSCDGDEEEIALMWIAAEREMITSSVGGECYPGMKYKMNEQDNWSALGQRIDGFDYEEGYAYLLRVKITHIKHPVADQSTETYALVEIVSKTYKPKETACNMSVFNELINYLKSADICIYIIGKVLK